ncbi:MAG TPA: hypothetical protein ENJ44_06980 [Oceanospirillales bacterium]|nr:hypothetical protein [Oceanospirillales bacterium]
MLQQFTAFLHQSIPLTKHMQLELTAFDSQQLTLSAPLDANINDKGSVFGGSSSALMIIAAWSLIKLNCQKRAIEADVVIHKNSTHWQKALFKDFIITAKFKKQYDFKQIAQSIIRKKHQRISCLIEIADKDGTIYSTMSAKYVIITKK